MLNQIISSGSPPTHATLLIFSAILRGLKGSREAFGLILKNVHVSAIKSCWNIRFSRWARLRKPFSAGYYYSPCLHFLNPATFSHSSICRSHLCPYPRISYPISSVMQTPYRSCCSYKTSTRWWRWWAASATAPSHGLKTHRRTSALRPTRCWNTFLTCSLSAHFAQGPLSELSDTILSILKAPSLTLNFNSQVFNNLTELVTSCGNYSQYRKRFSECSGFRFPILGVHLKDLIAVHVALPDWVDKEKTRVNLTKTQQLYTILQELTLIQNTHPNIDANTDLLNLLTVSKR